MSLRARIERLEKRLPPCRDRELTWEELVEEVTICRAFGRIEWRKIRDGDRDNPPASEDVRRNFDEIERLAEDPSIPNDPRWHNVPATLEDDPYGWERDLQLWKAMGTIP